MRYKGENEKKEYWDIACCVLIFVHFSIETKKYEFVVMCYWICFFVVFRCCAFISELEHTYFSGGNNQSSLPKIQQEHAENTATVDDR